MFFTRQVFVISHRVIYIFTRNSGKSAHRVAILGAAGNVGQPLAMMLKNSNYVDELALYDVRSTNSLAKELSQIDTKCQAISYDEENLEEALQQANTVVIVANAPKCENLDFACMFKPNAQIIHDLTQAFSKVCPKAFLAIATNPLNSLVPIACEVLIRKRVFDERRVFGITTLDFMRANVYTARMIGARPETVKVPVIGGHSDKTIVPILSICDPATSFTKEEAMEITEYVQTASEDLLRAKKPGILAMSSAFAIARFVISLARAKRNEPNIVECAYVKSNVFANLKYLATPLKLSPVGIEKNLGVPPLSEYEEINLQQASFLIKADIKRGEDFIRGNKNTSCTRSKAERLQEKDELRSCENINVAKC